MAVSAPPRPELAWVCPECGHGSPEPRDHQAHLDAHRKLRRFFDEWEAAGAAEQAAARPRRRRRPLYYVAAALVVVLLAAISLRGTRPQPADLPSSGAPVTGAPAPRPDADPTPGVDPRAAAPAPAPTRPGPPMTVAGSPTTPAAVAPAGPGATPAPAPGPASPPAAVMGPPATPAPATPAPVEPLLTVRGCVLRVICVTLGG